MQQSQHSISSTWHQTMNKRGMSQERWAWRKTRGEFSEMDGIGNQANLSLFHGQSFAPFFSSSSIRNHGEPEVWNWSDPSYPPAASEAMVSLKCETVWFIYPPASSEAFLKTIHLPIICRRFRYNSSQKPSISKSKTAIWKWRNLHYSAWGGVSRYQDTVGIVDLHS